MNLNERLYHALADWVPQLQDATGSTAFYAHSRLPDDLSIYCEVNSRGHGAISVHVTHDTPDRPRDKLDMTFRVTPEDRTAVLTHLDQGIDHDVLCEPCANPNRLVAATLFAANWVTVMMGMQFCLQPVDTPVTHTA